ncbi:uncharacterized protein TRAVEDRAFT_75251 [Trametes versicolor FP-101664 SS1]|uniref:uncharacterized protein n=1 Tax=Trametes versicolor (strain FP-101664) TaxID=717944 RepID=UPI0004621BDA|nr:uncharacterized protein TRAVEDRAFT_75251 [Trametes versicolor FP-101664 SS1]EIW53136.1 hypothetical protein TRAVEDRAFT_75251 [Trametes versicolor FP-101664 SS1]
MTSLCSPSAKVPPSSRAPLLLAFERYAGMGSRPVHALVTVLVLDSCWCMPVGNVDCDTLVDCLPQQSPDRWQNIAPARRCHVPPEGFWRRGRSALAQQHRGRFGTRLYARTSELRATGINSEDVPSLDLSMRVSFYAPSFRF